MIIPVEKSGSRFVAFVSLFTAMIAVLDSIPMIPAFYTGIWGSWMFILSPLIGVLLGPYVGAVSVGMGNLVGHLLFFRGASEFLFMLAAPFGAGMAGLVFQQKWKPVFGVYTALLVGYISIDPVSWQLPIWGIWDILMGYGFIMILIVLTAKNTWSESLKNSSSLLLALSAIIGLESDILFRVFILVPGQAYRFLYDYTVEVLQALWVGAGFITPLKVMLAVIATVILGRAIIASLAIEAQTENLI